MVQRHTYRAATLWWVILQDIFKLQVVGLNLILLDQSNTHTITSALLSWVFMKNKTIIHVVQHYWNNSNHTALPQSQQKAQICTLPESPNRIHKLDSHNAVFHSQ